MSDYTKNQDEREAWSRADRQEYLEHIGETAQAHAAVDAAVRAETKETRYGIEIYASRQWEEVDRATNEQEARELLESWSRFACAGVRMVRVETTRVVMEGDK
jgi:hypothetical protein